MRRLSEFVNLTMEGAAPGKRGRRRDGNGGASSARQGRAIGVIGVPGDRRDEDQREYGALAASAFEVIHVREDANLRGRGPGVSAANVLAGIEDARRAGARNQRADAILDELEAARLALTEAGAGDMIVVCADDAPGVYQLAMAAGRLPGRGTAITDPGELAVPEG